MKGVEERSKIERAVTFLKQFLAIFHSFCVLTTALMEAAGVVEACFLFCFVVSVAEVMVSVESSVKLCDRVRFFLG